MLFRSHKADTLSYAFRFNADGFTDMAIKKPAHPGRVGGKINPVVTVVHTTDMMPNTFKALLDSWTGKAGNGACAHFIIDRDGKVYQLVSIFRNGNHAGGPIHGNFKLVSGELVHPNLVSVGVELHAGGLLKGKPGAWVHPDSGLRVDDDDVIVDVKGRGWHRVTAAQLGALDALLNSQIGRAHV